MSSSNLLTNRPSPRGERHIIYVSDPSSIARRHLPNATTEADLRRWVDELADAGTDTFIQEAFTQGWTTYWRTDKFEYDARPQHRRFLPLLDAGVQPLAALLDQSHKRGMEFMAGMRVNDNHGHVSVRQGAGAGASFLTNNPQWQIKDAKGSVAAKMSVHMDFTHAEVRNFVTSVAEHMLDQFDLDGIELCFRDREYFPDGVEEERAPLMTDFVRSVRDVLHTAGTTRGRNLMLGVRVYATLEICRAQGLDIPTWIKEGLINYVAPGDLMYMATNEPMEQFGELTRDTGCMFYPGMLPHNSARRLRLLGGEPLNADQQRAVAQNYFAAGADGLSFYNHPNPVNWAPFYPMQLFTMHELGDPEKVARGARHYVFEPILAGQALWSAGVKLKERPESQRIALSRAKPNASGKFRFRICEDLTSVRRASLLFRAYNMVEGDELEVHVNGTAIEPPLLRFRADEDRIDVKGKVDISSSKTAGVSPVPAIPDSFMTGWFQLTSPPAVFGDNYLEVTLKSCAPPASEDIVIDVENVSEKVQKVISATSASEDIVIEEIEVHVAP